MRHQLDSSNFRHSLISVFANYSNVPTLGELFSQLRYWVQVTHREVRWIPVDEQLNSRLHWIEYTRCSLH